MDRPADTTIRSLLLRLLPHLSKRRKVQLALILGVMILSSFAEIVSLGAILPFLGVLIDPESVFRNEIVRTFAGGIGVHTTEGMRLPLTVFFISAALLSGVLRIVQIWVNTRVSFATGADLSIALYERTLYQPYAVHVARNSSTVIDAVATKVGAMILQGVMPAITMVSSALILLSIVTTLIIISPVVALSAFVGFGLTYVVIIRITRHRLKANSEVISRESQMVVQSLQEGLGGIRDVLLDGTQGIYTGVYSHSAMALRRTQAKNQFIGQSPRFAIEAMGMFFIAIIAYWLTGQTGGATTAIPVLGTLALGAQRMLPAMQQLFSSWSVLQGGAVSMGVILDMLDQPAPMINGNQQHMELLPFTRSLALRGLSFRYTPDAQEVLLDIDLTLPKGSRIGFIGTTGSGKSTLLDIVMGLLEPTKGTVEVDGVPVTSSNRRAWQRHIAHVPQSIFLSDNSIEENIALGVPKKSIDKERVMKAARQAQIAAIIESWPKQYRTFVGERGVRLSGGQRQRIGIARALYKQADVIIFDEATSALDNQTEGAVMQAIEELHEELTVLIIAHRLTTLRNCDMVVELEHGRIKATGTYEEIVSTRSGATQPVFSTTSTSC